MIDCYWLGWVACGDQQQAIYSCPKPKPSSLPITVVIVGVGSVITVITITILVGIIS